MNLQVVYCTHQDADLAVRERLAFSSREQMEHAYSELRRQFPTSEVVLLSTCNRVEVYAAQSDAPTGLTRGDLARFLSEFHRIPLEEFVDELGEQTGPDAVRHLFRVVSSLDSMVLGEPQIVNQVKEAYRLAEANGSCGPLTHALFQGAIRTSNRVRTETRLSEGRVSIASVAVGEFGKSIFDSFGDKCVLIIGAGAMAEETLRYLADEGVGRIVVVNRSPERALALAQEWGGETAPWESLDHWLGRADVIVSTTGAGVPIVSLERFQAARQAAARNRSVFILDLAAPRDFDPAVRELDDVFLYDIDSLQKTCDKNRAARQRELQNALQIVDEETGRFMAEFYNRAGSAIVTRLREDWHGISQQELQRLFQKLPHLTENDREAVERTVSRIVNKLLHPPLEALRDEAKEGAPVGLLLALKRLFHLSD